MGSGGKVGGWIERRKVDVLFSDRVEREESHLMFDGGHHLVGGTDRSIMKTIVFLSRRGAHK